MIGQELNNRYTVTTRLGKGAMGTVYRATDSQFGREVAVKVISGDLAIDPDMLERFKREREALGKLKHPNIVEFLDAFPNEEQYVIVMEYVPGGSLHELIEKGPVPIERASRIAIELCDALIRSHHLNIIHRDLKPENILIAGDGTPKLADFGVARLSEGTRMTRSGTQVGTPYYMAPEAWEGKTLDAQSDIWSLGVIFFEMLTGQVPFGGDTGAAVMNKVLTTSPPDLKKFRSDVPAGMAKIVTRMLTRDKSRRYQTMRQVAVDLESLRFSATPMPSPAPRAAGRPGISAFINGRILLLAGLVVAGLLVAVNFPSIRTAFFPPDSTEAQRTPTEPISNPTEPAQDSSSLVPDGLWLQILGRGYIVVATDPNYAPQSFLNSEGVRPGDTKCPADTLTEAEMQGFDVDVALAVGDNLGVETCFATPAWDLITAGSWAGKWDISVGSMTITTSRQEVLDFSVPYYYTPAVVAVRTDTNFASLADLEGQALCAGASTTYEFWLNRDLEGLGLPASSIYAEAPEVTVVPLATDQECAQAIASGRQDFVGYVTSETVVNANLAEGFPVRKLGAAVFSEDLAMAFDKNSALGADSLRARINEVILSLQENRALTVLSNQWFGANLTQPPVSRGSGTDCTSPDVFCVGLVTQVGAVDDQSFNQASWEGVLQAGTELGAQVQFIETTDAGDYEKNIAVFGDEGYDVIVTVGFEIGAATIAAASAYPEVDFIGVDQFQAETTEGVAGLGFHEDNAGFLVGALAAMMSESHKIGAVCGTDEVPPVWRYGEGYRAGAAYADDLNGTTTEVFVVYHSDVGFDQTFTDPAFGAQTAQSLMAQGVDVVFGCGGSTGNGAITTAAQAGAYAIGVDVDQYFTLPEAAPRMLSSALKLIIPGVFDLVKAARDGVFPSGNITGEAGFAPFHDLEDEVPADVKVIMEKLLADLTSGAIQTHVPASKSSSSLSSECYAAEFVADVTVPDGTQFSPGEAFIKTWRLRNVGSCTWTAEVSLVFSFGDIMDGSTPQLLTNEAVPGQTIEVSIDLTAPTSPGSYQGLWQLKNPEGEEFGDKYYVLIEVK